MDEKMAQATPPQAAPPRKVNKILWTILLLPSLLILAASIGLYYLVPMRDAFLRGETNGSYLLLGTFAAYSPKFWIGGVAAVLFAIMLIVSIGRSARRKEFGYWQRLLGLIALTASGAILLVIGLPDIGGDARDAGSVNFGGYSYHLLVQEGSSLAGTRLHFMIFVCDAQALNCQRVHNDYADFVLGDRVPPLNVLQIIKDGNFLSVRGNSVTEYVSFRP